MGIKLNDIDIKILNQGSWNSTKHDLTNLFQQLFSHSTCHDMSVGYFTSGWVSKNAHGIAQFLTNEGKARWVMSPNLRRPDDPLLEEYDNSDFATKTDIAEKILAKDVEEVAELLRDKNNILPSIKQLIEMGRLEIKVCVPSKKEDDGLFHPKVHIFQDSESNKILLTGSGNSSRKMQEKNLEKFNLHSSFKKEDRHENFPDYEVKKYIQPECDDFDELYSGTDTFGYRTQSLSDAAKNNIINIIEDASSRRHEDVDDIPPSTSPDNPIFHIPDKYYEDEAYNEIQKKALDKCREKNYSIILEMATGTGKTITAIKAFKQSLDESEEEDLLLVVACPNTILVEQWGKEFIKCGIDKTKLHTFHTADKKDKAKMVSQIDGQALVPKFEVMIITHEALKDQAVMDSLRGIKEQVFFMVDEIHHVIYGEGFYKYNEIFFNDFNKKIGLTATVKKRVIPEDWDILIADYFGPDSVCEIVNLEDAIHKYHILCEYEYCPIQFTITYDEFVEGVRIYQTIRPYKSNDPEDDSGYDNQTAIWRLTKWLNGLESKLDKMLGFLDDDFCKAMSKCLFFIPGQHTEGLQEHLAKKDVSFGYINADTSREHREILLQQLGDEMIQSIISHLILDEGIDIPSIEMAFITASHREPRQGVQRRGRVLRKSEGKTRAIIYDMYAQVDESHLELALSTKKKDLGESDVRSAKKFIQWLIDREKTRVDEFNASASPAA